MPGFVSWKRFKGKVRLPTRSASIGHSGIWNYEEVYNTARTASAMVEGMSRLYPDVKAEDFAIHWQARLLFPHSSPDWLTPLPGKPGKIFLNPGGGFDGDPPRE
jgi:hypothetical protein